MNKKITLVELAALMAESTSTTPRVCELFLKDLFATVAQALIDGESVKVKGLGTFKVAQVKPRKSVNVRTGEDMQVAGYRKVTFTPDKSLAEAVNQPFAHFESVFLDDAVTDEQLAEIDKQHPSTITEQPADEAAEQPVTASTEAQEPNPVSEPEPEPEPEPVEETASIAPEVQESEVPAAPLPFDLPEMTEAAPAPEPDALYDPELDDNTVAPQPKHKGPALAIPLPDKPAGSGQTPERKPMLVGRPIDGPSQPTPEPEKTEEVETNRRFYRPEPRNAYTPTPEQIEEADRKHEQKRHGLWIILGLLGAALLIWAIARGCSETNAEQHEKEVVAADTISEGADSVVMAQSEPEPKPEVKPEPKPEPKPAASSKGEVTDVVTSQIVLTTLSEKHYGSPWFWVYIYEENVARGIINDPNNIRPGTRVVIPPASKYGINPKDKASLRKAQIKSMEYLKGH